MTDLPEKDERQAKADSPIHTSGELSQAQPKPHAQNVSPSPDRQVEGQAEPQSHSQSVSPIQALADDQPNDEIEADDNEALERDSAFGDNESIASSRTSLTSGITRYRQENGRRYHAYRDGKYLFPNDEKEQDRLDLFHHVFNLLFGGKLFHAPVDNPQRVLDVGTGTGIWAIDFADQHPSSHVVGCDLSPIQPGWIPPNLEFEVDDIEDTWRHKPFNFIHMRMLGGAIKDWEALIAQAYDNLEPGGWLESVEFEVWVDCQNDGEVEMPKMIQQWQSLLTEAGERIGRTFIVAVHMKNWMEKAGFVDIREDVIKVPNSPWAKDPRWKEIGAYQQHNMLEAASAYGQAHFTRVLGWSPDEFLVLSAEVRKELKNLKYHLFSNLHIVYGQKPE
ncbi:Secondary metabolism regulator [Lachnellula suecica]|uniref:Secondary metabolism regulator n=1 Tax=Lachnellula suecica TaxID=602035 RepID=A0A8T9CGJ6_9HELO|nr:Secondary metabolism regulator [Lachnellula suecica]